MQVLIRFNNLVIVNQLVYKLFLISCLKPFAFI